MGKLIEMETESGKSIFIESSVSEDTGEVVEAGGIDKIREKLDDLLKVVNPLSETILNSLEHLPKRPDTVTAEFGLSFTVEGSVFVAKASGGATLNVTLAWSSKENESNT
jgi:Trypsin-co-occurring domain 1